MPDAADEAFTAEEGAQSGLFCEFCDRFGGVEPGVEAVEGGAVVFEGPEAADGPAEALAETADEARGGFFEGSGVCEDAGGGELESAALVVADAFCDIGLDGHVVGEGAGVIEDRLDFHGDPVFAAGAGVVDDFSVEGFDVGDFATDHRDGVRV